LLVGLVQNMTQEIKRLEGKLENNRHKYSRLLEKQLNLQGVGFPDRFVWYPPLSIVLLLPLHYLPPLFAI
jgi:hypothetical protein